MPERLLSGEAQPDDEHLDLSLRPKRLADFVGQSQVKDNLGIAMQAAKMRGEPLDHVVIYSPPGLGKTTLAHIIARRWMQRFGSPPAQPSSGRAIWQPY